LIVLQVKLVLTVYGRELNVLQVRIIIDCVHVIYSLPPGENPIADNKYYYYVLWFMTEV
jgi:hypothetical protein